MAFFNRDIAFGLGIMMMLAVLIVPLPAILLDLALALSIAFSILIMMTAIFIQHPLEFNIFPTVLLVATMIRLGLNVASTRLILSAGHEGTHAAGRIIQAFGQFMMQGNFVIGMIIFGILVIINFIVITKGSGRIAEVSARFSLDAMPGKQMAVDADLSAGLIDEKTARKRRKDLEDESSFYGSMDGAAKFVRGDAIAGLLITIINIIGGMVIGIMQKNLSITQALQSYTILTVGDGLVSQVPGLVVSTAAGMLVSKAGVEGTTEQAFLRQLSSYPSALGICAFFLLLISLLPNMPMPPFLLLACGLGVASWKFSQTKENPKEEPVIQPKEDDPSKNISLDFIRLELGYGILPLLNENSIGPKLTEQIKNLRKHLAQEIGFVMPVVRIQDNMHLPNNGYSIHIKEWESARGEIRPYQWLVMNASGEIEISGERVKEPTFGLPAKWVDDQGKQDANLKGYTVVDPITVMSTHLTEVVRENMAELLSYDETQKLLDNLPDGYRKLQSDLIPTQISLSNVQRILQNLLSEKVSIRDLPTILEAISEACGYSKNISHITEHVRYRLARQISCANLDNNKELALVQLSSEWEQRFLEYISPEGDSFTMPPSVAQDFGGKVKMTLDKMIMRGESPILISSAKIRPYVKSVLERIRPNTILLSHQEIHPKVSIKMLGQVSI